MQKQIMEEFDLKKEYLEDLIQKLDANLIRVKRKRNLTLFGLPLLGLLIALLSYKSINQGALKKLNIINSEEIKITPPKVNLTTHKNKECNLLLFNQRNPIEKTNLSQPFVTRNSYPINNIIKTDSINRYSSLVEYRHKTPLIDEDFVFGTKVGFNTLCKAYIEKLNTPALARNYQYTQSKVIDYDARISFLFLNGINYSQPLISSSSNSKLNLKNSERGSFSYTTSLLINRKLTDKLSASLGIQYSTYGSNNNFVLVHPHTPGAIKRIDIVIDTQRIGGTSIRIDTTKDTLAYLTQYKNQFSYVEVPLMLGFYKKTNKIELGVQAGISLAFLAKKKGYFVDNSDIRNQEDKSKQLIINGLFSPSIYYQAHRKLKIGIQPMFKVNLNSVSISEPINRRYLSYQFNLGVKYYL